MTSEVLQVVEDAFLDLNSLAVVDRIFAKEIQVHDKLLALVLRVQLYVFYLQRTAAHCVCFAVVFLVSSAESKL